MKHDYGVTRMPCRNNGYFFDQGPFDIIIDYPHFRNSMPYHNKHLSVLVLCSVTPKK